MHKKRDLINKLTGLQALQILRRLIDKEGVVSETVEKVAREILSDVDIEEVAEDVFWALDTIDVHDCWNMAGASYDEYISPEDAAVILVEEALQEFVDQINRYHELGMLMEEQLYCVGIVLGAYRYEQDSDSEFKDWCADMPLECVRSVLDDWRKRTTNTASSIAVNDLIKLQCPKWAEHLIRD